MKSFKHHLLFALLLILFVQCKDKEIPETIYTDEIADHAMVVTAREEASKIGIEILHSGGNAFDAMVATELALAVSYPVAGNLAGGGFMVYRQADGSIGALDYREKAPMASDKDMYLDEDGEVIPGLSTLGALAVGVPGTVAGIFEVHRKFGSLPLEDIIRPVITLARKGIIITEKQERRLAYFEEAFHKANKEVILWDKPWKENDTVANHSLANTLELLLLNGPEDFYEGEIAQRIVDFIQDNGGIITMEDMASYEPQWREPITFTYDDLRIISMSPPSSGGICLAQIMKSIESFDLEKYGHNQTQMIQVLVEAERRSYADRSYFLGDPDFVDIPVEQLISKEYLDERMSDFSFDYATSSDSVSHGNVLVYESNETTHYSIVDSLGNAVSVTTTINGAYGSKLYSNELGFFFNNEMDDFSAKPGVPNMFGLVGAEANAIEPEKRMLSSMTPTIVEKDGKLYMVLGTPGGSTIITSVLQTILNIHEYHMTAQEAVSAPRFHHQWLPDKIRLEPDGFDSATKEELISLGYELHEDRAPVIGKVECILVLEDGRLEGGADPRGDDKALGY